MFQDITIEFFESLKQSGITEQAFVDLNMVSLVYISRAFLEISSIYLFSFPSFLPWIVLPLNQSDYIAISVSIYSLRVAGRIRKVDLFPPFEVHVQSRFSSLSVCFTSLIAVALALVKPFHTLYRTKVIYEKTLFYTLNNCLIKSSYASHNKYTMEIFEMIL